MNNKSKLLISLIMIFSYFSVGAIEQLPADPSVRAGKLENGLTYYIFQNNWPKDKVDFYIAQRVGSIQEEENQRGLAHFLEHMCFNGTKHFPGNSIISYLESVGVKFGADLNAYTSTDETVYNISNVPTKRTSVLDSCFLILSDWSHELNLNGKDIDAERGVIEGEWRHRSGANNRMLEKALVDIYPGSKYAKRMPIGLMDVVKNFKYKELRDYYKKWYNPNNQAIVVVGNIDVDYAENKIKQLFGKVKNPKNLAIVEDYPVPDTDKLICSVQKDKEQNGTNIILYFKHDGLNPELNNTIEELRNSYLQFVVSRMLNTRFSDMNEMDDVPFVGARVSDGKFLVSKTKEALTVRASSKTGMESECVKWMENGVRQAVEFGFTKEEFDIANRSYLALVDDMFRNKNRMTNKLYAKSLIDTYLSGTSNISIDDFHKYVLQLSKNISVADANKYISNIVNTTSDANAIVLAYCPDKENEVIPTKQQLESSFHSARKVKLTAYADTVLLKPLMTKLPVSGKIVKEEPLKMFDAKLWTLSNGAKVYLKKTDANENEIVISATSPGGYSMLDMNKLGNMKLLNDAIAGSGFGELKSSEFNKVLSGRKAKVNIGLANFEESMGTSTTPADLETAMQVIYIKFTSPIKDEKSFQSLINRNKIKLKKGRTSPRLEMGDSIHSVVYCNHPIGIKLTSEMLDSVSYTEIIDTYKERFGNAADFTFFIVGNFDEAKLRPLVEQYIASLPTKMTQEKAKNVNYHLINGQNHIEYERPMESPQTIAYSLRHVKCEYNIPNVINASLFQQIIKMVLLKEIREDRGWTYSIQTHCNVVPVINAGSPSEILFPIYTIVTPGKGLDTYKIIRESIAKIANDGPDEAMFNKSKLYMQKIMADQVNDNSYWNSVMKAYSKYGKDMYSDWSKTVDNVTAKDVQEFAKKYIMQAECTELMMKPDAASMEKSK